MLDAAAGDGAEEGAAEAGGRRRRAGAPGRPGRARPRCCDYVRELWADGVDHEPQSSAPWPYTPRLLAELLANLPNLEIVATDYVNG